MSSYLIPFHGTAVPCQRQQCSELLLTWRCLLLLLLLLWNARSVSTKQLHERCCRVGGWRRGGHSRHCERLLRLQQLLQHLQQQLLLLHSGPTCCCSLRCRRGRCEAAAQQRSQHALQNT
jgi:hypothetical protein